MDPSPLGEGRQHWYDACLCPEAQEADAPNGCLRRRSDRLRVAAPSTPSRNAQQRCTALPAHTYTQHRIHNESAAVYESGLATPYDLPEGARPMYWTHPFERAASGGQLRRVQISLVPLQRRCRSHDAAGHVRRRHAHAQGTLRSITTSGASGKHAKRREAPWSCRPATAFARPWQRPCAHRPFLHPYAQEATHGRLSPHPTLGPLPGWAGTRRRGASGTP